MIILVATTCGVDLFGVNCSIHGPVIISGRVLEYTTTRSIDKSNAPCATAFCHGWEYYAEWGCTASGSGESRAGRRVEE